MQNSGVISHFSPEISCKKLKRRTKMAKISQRQSSLTFSFQNAPNKKCRKAVSSSIFVGENWINYDHAHEALINILIILAVLCFLCSFIFLCIQWKGNTGGRWSTLPMKALSPKRSAMFPSQPCRPTIFHHLQVNQRPFQQANQHQRPQL